MSFRALNLSPQIMQAVHDAGYTEPTPIQVAAIPLISAGHDIIGIAQTGTGKTAAFVLPILMKLAESKQAVTQVYNAARNRQSGSDRGPRALVVAPTRELVAQIVAMGGRVYEVAPRHQTLEDRFLQLLHEEEK